MSLVESRPQLQDIKLFTPIMLGAPSSSVLEPCTIETWREPSSSENVS
jgi:hypothetical protein